jgi:putative membrane protein
MKQWRYYWEHHNEQAVIGLTAFFLFAGVVQYAIGWRYVLALTPLVIGILAALTVLYWHAPAGVKAALFTIAFSIGMITEIIGVNSGVLFGDYWYGTILGLKIAGVPILVGITWAYVTIAAWQLVSYSTFSVVGKIIIAAGVIVMFDLLLEQYATAFGLWQWQDGIIPLKNYVTWFAVGIVLVSLYARYAQQKKPSLYGASVLPLTALFFWCMLLVR